MSHQINAANSASTNKAATAATTATAVEPIAAVKQSSSLFSSLKKQKKKDEASAVEQLTSNDNVNVVKRQHRDSEEEINLNCLLLADTSLDCAPAHVQNLLQHFMDVQLTPGEILFLLVYIVALESGFVTQMHYEEEKFYLDALSTISSFHSKNILRLSHLKPTYTRSDDLRCFTLKLRTLVAVENDYPEYLYSQLVAFVMGDLLIVTLSPANSTNGKGFSTALSIGRYVLSIQAKDKPLHQRFRKLTELTYTLREKLFVPMRIQQLDWLNFSLYPALDSLPAELYAHILKNLQKKDLKAMANVNKTLNNITKHCKF